MVPMLYYTFNALGYPAAVTMHMAVATSAAVIIVTSPRSALGHHKKDAVDWSLVWPRPVLGKLFQNWGLWIGFGALMGSWVMAKFLSGEQLTLLFGLVAAVLALQFIMGRPDWGLASDVPGPPAAPLAGTVLGALCALMGIGFGSIGVTLMLLFGKTIHRAIGTAAAIGFFIGFPAAIGYIISGWGLEGLPPWSLGYVNLLGFGLMAVMTYICVPFGVKLAHDLNQARLRKFFGICLLLVAFNMVRKVVF